MAILMRTEVPGAGAALAEGMRQAGVLDALRTARGFRGHWSGAASSGYRVTEMWDSREDCQAFFDSNIVPNFPPGIEPPQLEFFELNLEIKPAP
jgi:heme-degrading monooxygenase HmoA